MPEKKKCALYVRVSTLMQDVDKEAGSLSSQESLLRRYVEQKNALGPETWEVVEVYRESASAKDTRRKEFQRLLRAVNDGRISAVLFCKLDRISRSVGDLLRLVEFFREHHCEFISLHENLDTSGPMGRFMLVLFGALAEFERATTHHQQVFKQCYLTQRQADNGTEAGALKRFFLQQALNDANAAHTHDEESGRIGIQRCIPC